MSALSGLFLFSPNAFYLVMSTMSFDAGAQALCE